MKKQLILDQFENAFSRLKEAYEINLSEPLALDGTVQRFEFTFELAWKTLRVFLEEEGVSCQSPRSCLKAAFKIGWIKNEENWLSILKARNMTSHIYNEDMAMDLYEEVKKKYFEFENLIQEMKNLLD